MNSQPPVTTGFTLIELLIVIAIVAILTALGLINYGRWRANSAVTQGAQEFTQAVRNTRSGAKRANACWQVSLVAFTATNTQYQVKEYSGPTCPVGTSTLLRTTTTTMPPNTRLVHVDASGNVVTTTSIINFVPPMARPTARPTTIRCSGPTTRRSNAMCA